MLERETFSPPLKMTSIKLDRPPDIIASAVDVLHDSLEEDAEVVDRVTGDLIKVIFDPVLKCYYEPSRNVYYQVNEVVNN